MKKIIYIPNQKKECYFDKGTPDWEQLKKERNKNDELRKRLNK